ncbi:MAG: cytochrome P450 [Alphaproteobacteria bacterium]|nr:cytochrome P450 [Alphaproteobacteria bacterium]
MESIAVSRYEDASLALRNENLAQSLYDEGAVIMQDVLLTLHGDQHRARRTLEFRVFRRDFFRWYETEVFPRTLAETMAPYEAAGRADLIDLGYRVTMNLTADFAGIDRPARTPQETAQLLKLVMTFSEGATLVHSTRDKDAVRAEVRAALAEFDAAFLKGSIDKRKALLARFAKSEIAEDALPRDVLTVLLRNEDKLELPPEILRREMAFYLQAGSHSTANSTTHALHELLAWCEKRPQDRARLESDPLFLQRCVHESFRLHPASPVAWRRPVCPVSLAGGHRAGTEDRVVVDLHQANRDPAIFGADADVFNPHRVLPPNVPPFGLTFGTGVHSCLGRDLDGGVLPRADADPATHQLGIVPLFVRTLLAKGARLDPKEPPVRAQHTARPNWGRYPILLGR